MNSPQDKHHKKIGVGVILNQQGKILIDRRLDSGEMGGLWEFPGGKIELNETVEECIGREILEELGIIVTVGKQIKIIEHNYPKFVVTIFVHYCHYVSGNPQAIECSEFRWVKPEDLNKYCFPEANYQIINLLTSAI